MNPSLSKPLRAAGLAAAIFLAMPAAADTVLWGSSAGGDPGSLFRIRTATGAAERVGSNGLGQGIRALAVDPRTGTLYGILGSACTGAALVTLDQGSGAATLVGKISGKGFLEKGIPGKKASGKKKGKHGAAAHNKGKSKPAAAKAKGACDGGAEALTFAADGTLYVGGWNGGSHGGKILKVDKRTGAVLRNTPVESVQGKPARLAALATAPDGTLWAAHGAGVPAVLRTIDPKTGRFLSSVRLHDHKAVISDLAFDDQGVLYAALEAGKLVTITTSGHRAGRLAAVGHFGKGKRIAGLALLGVEVRAVDCTAKRGGCNPTGGQAIRLPEGFKPPPGATITQKKLVFTDPRVAAKRCGRDPLVLFGGDPEKPVLVIPEYLCGSPQFVVLATEANLDVRQGTVTVANDPGIYFDDALSCDTPVVGDPQQQDVVVWQPTDHSDVLESHAISVTSECGTSRARIRGLSYFVVGMHIDFGLDWNKNPWAVRQAFVDLTDVKLHFLTVALLNAKRSLAKDDYARLLVTLGAARLAFKFRLYKTASRELVLFIRFLEKAKFKPGSGFNHSGELEMRAHNARFTLDQKVIGILH